MNGLSLDTLRMRVGLGDPAVGVQGQLTAADALLRRRVGDQFLGQYCRFASIQRTAKWEWMSKFT
jgi:hypothetical protein